MRAFAKNKKIKNQKKIRSDFENRGVQKKVYVLSRGRFIFCIDAEKSFDSSYAKIKKKKNSHKWHVSTHLSSKKLRP